MLRLPLIVTFSYTESYCSTKGTSSIYFGTLNDDDVHKQFDTFAAYRAIVLYFSFLQNTFHGKVTEVTR